MQKLLLFLQFLLNLIFPPKTPVATSTLDLGFDPVPLATALVTGGTEAIKAYAAIKAVADDPAHLQAAAAQQKLDEIDKLVAAQKANQLEQQRLDAENGGQS